MASLWSWLPAFRAIAEHEHLPSASAALHVSASSLSRTLRLLEEDVGQRLFDRVGRSLVLNDAGRTLLVSVRFAMRSVHDALTLLGPSSLVGRITVHCPAPLAPLYVLPALTKLGVDHPALVPVIRSVQTPQISSALRQGTIDVAVAEQAIAADDLTVVELAEIPHAVCCGPGHPLFGRARPSEREIVDHPFVAPTMLEDGRVPDHWPEARRRKIGLFVTQLQVGLDACKSGVYLAVLPWPVAERAGLHRLPMRGIRRGTLHAVHRPTLEQEGRTEALVRALLAAHS